MSDNASNNNQPLFQNADEQERIYAPEQVPGALNSDVPADVENDVPPAVTTTITTPELTMAAPASVATNKEAQDRNNEPR